MSHKCGLQHKANGMRDCLWVHDADDDRDDDKDDNRDDESRETQACVASLATQTAI